MADDLPVRGEVRGLIRHGRDAALTTAGATAIIWTTTILDWLLLGSLSAFSVKAWTLSGLLGIVVMPFVHGGLLHLFANTLAGIPLMLLTAERRVADVFVVGVVSALISGLFAWTLSAPGTLTIGASGVIFGFMGFLLARGIFERRLVPIALSLTTLFLFGGSLITLLPVAAGISWQAHLGGFLGGILVSAMLGRRLRRVAQD